MDLPTIVLGLLTIVGSGVASVVVTSRLNAQKTRQDLLRQRLEELFSSVQNFGHSFVLAMISYPDARRRLSLEQAQKELHKNWNNLSMISKRCENAKCWSLYTSRISDRLTRYGMSVRER